MKSRSYFIDKWKFIVCDSKSLLGDYTNKSVASFIVDTLGIHGAIRYKTRQFQY